MNLGLGDYGSDSENGGDSDNDTPIPSVPTKAPKPTPTKMVQPSLKQRKKVTIGLPALNPVDDDADELKDEQPPAKKPRLEVGAGKSSLLSMLPPPKQKNPVLPPPERVLGGGNGPGLVFNTSRRAVQEVSTETDGGQQFQDFETPTLEPSTSFAFRPPSLAKGRSNVSLEEGAISAPPPTVPKLSATPAVDFFSLGMCYSCLSKAPF